MAEETVKLSKASGNSIKISHVFLVFVMLMQVGLLCYLIISTTRYGGVSASATHRFQTNQALLHHLGSLEKQAQKQGEEVQQLRQQITVLTRQQAAFHRDVLASAQHWLNLAKEALYAANDVPTALRLLHRADALVLSHSGEVAEHMHHQLTRDINNLIQWQKTTSPSYVALALTQLSVKIQGLAPRSHQLPSKNTIAVTAAGVKPLPDWQQRTWKEWSLWVRQTIRHLVRLEYHADRSVAPQPLIADEEVNQLKQQWRQQLVVAVWAVLHSESLLYQASMAMLIQQLSQYKVNFSSAQLDPVLAELTRLVALSTEPPSLTAMDSPRHVAAND